MLAIKTFMILVHFGVTFGAFRKYSFTVNEVRVCYQLYNGVISDVYGISSLTACSILCAEDNCCSVLFDEMSERCITYTAFATSTTTGCGWKYAETGLDICRGSGPYMPSVPNECDHGYSYDASENKCRTECVSYGSTYGRFDDYVIWSVNNGILGSSEQECKDACVAETLFVCRTAQLHESGMCLLSVETALTQPANYFRHTSYTVWQRNCA